MKRLLLLLFVFAVLPTSSCVAATFNSVKAVTGTAPTLWNSQLNCALPPVTSPIPAGTALLHRCEWWQGGALLRTDTLTVVTGRTFTFQPPTIPAASLVTVMAYAFFSGEPSCVATLFQTPIVTTIPPAAPTISVAP